MFSAMPLKKSARMLRSARPKTMPITPVVASRAVTAMPQAWFSISAMPPRNSSTATTCRSSRGMRTCT